MAVFQHSDHCATLNNGSCTCEPSRYRNALLIAIPLMFFEHWMGSRGGSEALQADAWHLAGDGLHDLWAWGVALTAITYTDFKDIIRRHGGYVQSALLFLSGTAILWQLFVFGANPKTDGFTMFWVGSVAVGLNYWRFKLLHPHGTIWGVFKDVTRALKEGSEELTTFVAEVLHVISDVFVSVAASLGGLYILSVGESIIDEALAVGIAIFLYIFAFVVLVFARRHGGSTSCNHHDRDH